VRPRFFAGQVLRAAELTALEDYVIAKHQLHNRYLHGWGVVCGLQVVCGECGDDVVVMPGYAIDPCGRDVIVPEPTPFPVQQAIRDCLEAERAKPVCDPPTPGRPKGCEDEQRWCVTLRYKESPLRPMAPLASAPASACGCGGTSCGCGGAKEPRSGWDCNCGAGGTRATGTCGCQEPAAAVDLPAGCEPTRIVELFELGACRSDDDGCHDLEAVLSGTLPLRVRDCIAHIRPLFTKRLTKTQQRNTARLMLGESRAAALSGTREGICNLYDAVIELYERDPLRTRCVLPQELDDIDCSPRGDNEDGGEYANRLTAASGTLVTLVLAYVRDCLCHALLPPCPEDACDDRVILACLTVRDGKVVEICNFDCRRYAGSFTSRRYWLPIGPVAWWAIGMLCCFPLFRERGIRRKPLVYGMFDRVDRKGNARRAFVADDFAVLGDWRERLGRVGVRAVTIARGVVPESDEKTVRLSTFVAKPSADAANVLRERGVKLKEVEVDDPDAVSVLEGGLFPHARAGEKIEQLVHNGRVVGYRRG
jgi:hypothetical protein